MKNAQENRVTCRTCNGAGQVSQEVYDHPGRKPFGPPVIVRVTCTACNGAGQVFA